MSRLPLVMVLLLLAGCGGTTEPTTAPPRDASSPAPTGVASTDDSAGLHACDLLNQAVGDVSLMEPGVVEAIRSASQSADAPISDAAGRLVAAYAAAVAARGRPGEPDAVAAVSAAGVNMTRTCADAGLTTVG